MAKVASSRSKELARDMMGKAKEKESPRDMEKGMSRERAKGKAACASSVGTLGILPGIARTPGPFRGIAQYAAIGGTLPSSAI